MNLHVLLSYFDVWQSEWIAFGPYVERFIRDERGKIGNVDR